MNLNNIMTCEDIFHLLYFSGSYILNFKMFILKGLNIFAASVDNI